MKFLGIDEVVVIHERMVEFAGGKVGIREFTLLHSAIERPKASFASEFLYKDVWQMASALLQSLVKNHPFEDGNKRTAYFSTMRFLQKNKLKLTAPKEKYIRFMIEIDTRNKSVEDIAAWLHKYSNLVR